MRYNPLWQYCTPALQRDFLLSLGLLSDTGWDEAKRLRCLYALAGHAERHYRPVLIPKRDGTLRRLLAPDPLLRAVQRDILHRVLPERARSPFATAYFSGASIRAGALPHVGQPQVLKLDIEDFFGAITYGMVLQSAFSDCYYPPQIAALLAHLCCYSDLLPQGAPTSPALSNLVMRPFDAHMGAWCHQRGIAYTRYSDDMTFSGAFDARAVERKVRAFLEARGFTLNAKKTRHLTRGRRQVVTGVVVNEKAQVSRDTRRRLRQALYYCQRYGPAAHLARIGDTDYLPDGPAGVLRYLRSLQGRIGHVAQVCPQDAAFARMHREAGALVAAALSNDQRPEGASRHNA